MDCVVIVLEVECNAVALPRESNGSGISLNHIKRMTEEGWD